MIKSVKITNASGEALTLDLRTPEVSGVVVFSVDGLGPPKGNVSVNEVTNFPGGLFGGKSIEKRNIVMSLGFEESTRPVEATRRLLYKYMPVTGKVNIVVTSETMKYVDLGYGIPVPTPETRTYEIDGWVESNEPDIFSPYQSTKISIICPEPLFVTGVYTHTGLDDDTKTITYLGTQQVGFELSATILLITDKVEIQTSGAATGGLDMTGSRLQDALGPRFQVGDIVSVSSIPGHKKVTLKRGTKTHNALSLLGGLGGSWPAINPGVNRLKVTSEAPEYEDPTFSFSITYTELTEGV